MGKIRKKTSVISVQDILATIATFDIDDFICITDMAKAKEGESRAADIIKNWIRNLYNPWKGREMCSILFYLESDDNI